MGISKMKYRDIIGFSNKKQKFVKKTEKKVAPKPTVPPVTELLKKEFGPLNEWSEKPTGPKRWFKPMDQGLTEYEKEQMNEGPAYEYAKYTKKIDKLYDAYWDSVKDFGRALEKKGLRKQSKELYMKYRKQVSGFQQWFDKLIDSLM